VKEREVETRKKMIVDQELEGRFGVKR